MRVLVCGGRDYDDADFLRRSLWQLHLQPLFDLVIQGGAKGADQLAEQWCMDHAIPCLCVPAPWPTKGKSAGILRNLRMLEWKPDLVVAFPGGNGTAHMARIAVDAGIPLWQPQQHEELPSQLSDLLRIPRDRFLPRKSSHQPSAESNED